MPQVPLFARIAITWLAIFPLVAIVRFAIAPLVGSWPDLLQTALVMAIVVPIAVTWVMPFMMGAVMKRKKARAASSN